MKELTIKKETLDVVRQMVADGQVSQEVAEKYFPELCESEDEQIRKELTKHLKEGVEGYMPAGDSSDYRRWLEWLEKQGEIDKTSYDIAEKEKYDFVSGQFIECRKSFDEFKEDNSYWFEYVGNDTYIGRSDNILNKKFHITPRQLYRLFSQQHRPKENNMNEETNGPTAYDKYVDECLNDAAKHFFSDGEDKYSVANLFYAGVRCGQFWLEKQDNKESKIMTTKDITIREANMLISAIEYAIDMLPNHENLYGKYSREELREFQQKLKELY